MRSCVSLCEAGTWPPGDAALGRPTGTNYNAKDKKSAIFGTNWVRPAGPRTSEEGENFISWLDCGAIPCQAARQPRPCGPGGHPTVRTRVVSLFKLITMIWAAPPHPVASRVELDIWWDSGAFLGVGIWIDFFVTVQFAEWLYFAHFEFEIEKWANIILSV